MIHWWLKTISSEFYYNGTTRLAYGLENPNHTAAVISVLIPFFWAIQRRTSRKFLRVIWIALEIIFSFMLVTTVSRGGLLAWLLAVLTFGVLAALARGSGWALTWTAIRIVPMIGLTSVLSLGTRVQQAAQDKSVLNRLDLWRGGLEMVWCNPFSGYGAGKSGFYYTQWYSDSSSQAASIGMVNTYLHIAVEYGILPVVAALAVLITAMSCAWTRRASVWSCAYLASIVAYSAAAFFTTLWQLWGLDLFLSLILIVSCWSLRAETKGFSNAITRVVLAVVISSSLTTSALLLGRNIHARRELTVSRQNDGEWLVRRNTLDLAEIHIVVDQRTFGPDYGRILRRALACARPGIVLRIYEADVSGRRFHNDILAFGGRIDVISSTSIHKLIVCPKFSPQNGNKSPLHIYLNSSDPFLVNHLWISAAAKGEVEVMKIGENSANLAMMSFLATLIAVRQPE